MSTAPRSARARRFWGDDDSGTPIMHLDMDAFFVEAELLKYPHLRNTCVIVGGQSNRGVVSSASYEARAMGVHAGMPISQARRICPTATVLPVSHGYYSTLSQQVMEILRSYTPHVEQISVDEAFMDVGGARRLWGSPMRIAQMVRRDIREALSLPASVGIASTKLVAKIASSHAKPDGILLIPAQRTQDFLAELPVGAMWGVGAKTRETLHARGIDTIGQLAATPRETLMRWLGKSAGYRLNQLANGIDPRSVGGHRVEKSIGTETTFEVDIRQRDHIRTVMLDQSHSCARRLRAQKMKAMTVAIKVRASDFRTVTRSKTLGAPTDTAADISRVARGLFDKLPMPDGGIRLVGVRVENLVCAADGYQSVLDEDPRARECEVAMDSVASRFGPGVLKPATLLERPSQEEDG